VEGWGHLLLYKNDLTHLQDVVFFIIIQHNIYLCFFWPWRARGLFTRKWKKIFKKMVRPTHREISRSPSPPLPDTSRHTHN